MQQEKTEEVLVSLSFSSYSINGLAAIAVRVRKELDEAAEERALESLDEDNDDFEFSILLDNEGVLADEAIYDGQILPFLPNSNRNFLDREIGGKDDLSFRIPLKELFTNDREEGSSSSSSEGDELKTIPARTYCFWRPKLFEPSPNRSWKKKRNSTGSRSKPWKLCDLFRRSNSDGKGPFLSLIPNHRTEKSNKSKKVADYPKDERKSSDGFRKVTAGGESPLRLLASPLEVFYVRNRAEKEGGKRKSYLPYRQQLGGFFASVNRKGKCKSPLL